MIFLFDIGLPMIFPSMIMMILALLPVIAFEAYVINRELGIDGSVGFRASVIGNCCTTFVGIPVTWFCLAVLQIATGGDGGFGLDTTWKKILAFTWQAPWLIPYSDAPWLATAAMISLLIPYFFASWFLEYRITRGMLSRALYASHASSEDATDDYMKQLETEALFPTVSRAVRNANLVSYGGLLVILVLMLIL